VLRSQQIIFEDKIYVGLLAKKKKQCFSLHKKKKCLAEILFEKRKCEETTLHILQKKSFVAKRRRKNPSQKF